MDARGARPLLLAVALTALVSACRTPPTQIVLVVDTNLTKVDIDDVRITVGAVAPAPVDGSAAALDAATARTFDTYLTADGGQTFPLTLGIEPSGSPGGLEISVQALRAGNVVVEQNVATSFVPGAQRMLRVLLLDLCVGTSCPGGPAQTCNGGVCGSAVVDATELPGWTGALPPPPQPSPTAPIGGRSIWANGWHSCANEASTLYCWGRNTDGEIGDGTTVNAKLRVPVMDVSGPSAVGLGQLTSCVCDRSGKAWCWGRNVEGELGIGAVSVSSPLPVQVPGIDDCVQIAGGGLHTCVVHGRDGSVSCWGGNTYGQVGQPVSGSPSCTVSKGSSATPCFTSPMVVPGLVDVAEVRGGELYTCARKNDQTVWCWGDNTFGVLGDGTKTSRSMPAPVMDLAKDVAEIAAGRWFACARHQTGTVSCWGQNGGGQLGNNSTSDSARPVAVVGITDAIQIGGGQNHACALHASGAISCWGDNMDGQLGNATTTSSLVPVDVTGLDGVNSTAASRINSLAVGSNHNCVRSASGLAFCWGRNDVNEIGDSTRTNPRPSPVSVPGFE